MARNRAAWRTRILGALVALLAFASIAQTHAAPAATSAASGADGMTAARVIVRVRGTGTLMHAQALRAQAEGVAAERAAPRHAAALSQRTGLALSDGRAISPRAQVVFAQGLSSAALAARLRQDPEVESAVPDQRRHRLALPNDPLFPGGLTGTTPAVGQWYLRAPNVTEVSAINAAAAWDISTGSSSIAVAVLDSGVRFDHPDLAGRFFPANYGYDFIADTFTANDGDGRDADASDPGDWATQADRDADPANCIVEDSSWHGTQVSGLIAAATDNGIGMAGVARNVMLLPVRVLGKCGGFDSDIQAGMRWAAGLHVDGVPDNQHPAQVLNLSLGGAGACDVASGYPAIMAELATAKVSVVVAAGNDEGLAIGLPANCQGAIAVTGVRHIGTKVGFSNIGPEAAIAAPAGNCINLRGACLYPILTTTDTGTSGPFSSSYSDSFNASLGTSFSAPLVAGAAALVLSVKPTLTPEQVRSVLRVSARPFATHGAEASVVACRAPDATKQEECYCTTSTCGSGMLDAFAALTVLSKPVARITTASTVVAPGTAVVLDSVASAVPIDRQRLDLRWTLVDAGGGIVSLPAGTETKAQLNLMPSGVGQFVVALVVRDNTGASSDETRQTIVVKEPAPKSTAESPSVGGGGGGGGGGALSIEWLLALALCIGWLARRKQTQ